MYALTLPNGCSTKLQEAWPKIMVIEKGEEHPIGMPFVRAGNKDTARKLMFRLLLPYLEKQCPKYDWQWLYRDLFGSWWRELEPIVIEDDGDECDGIEYGESSGGIMAELEDGLSDFAARVDMNALQQLCILPRFIGTLRDLVADNTLSEYNWTDGYDKKRGVCLGYVEPAKKSKVLMIIDVSNSMPNSVSSDLLSLAPTLCDMSKADLIVTGAISRFYENEAARNLDPVSTRREIPRGNESEIFCDILKKLPNIYSTVIAFGDSDRPNEAIASESAKHLTEVKEFYSYFLGKKDWYGTSHLALSGYGRWTQHLLQEVTVHDEYQWVNFYVER